MTPLSQYTPSRYSNHPRPLTPEENRAIDRQCITARYPDDGEEKVVNRPHFALIEHRDRRRPGDDRRAVSSSPPSRTFERPVG